MTKELTIDLVKERVKINKEYTYKRLCELLEQKYNGGKAKRLQISDWERYFTMEKKGTKYTIISINDEELPKVDNRRDGNNSVYIPDIELIILDYLNKKEVKDGLYCATMSTNEWWYTLGMVNQIYMNKRVASDLVKYHDDIDWENLSYFMEDSRNVLTRIFVRALDSLKKREIINYHQEYIFITNESIEKINKDGTKYYETKKKFATVKEESIILEAQARAKIEYTKIFNKSNKHNQVELFATEKDIISNGGNLRDYYKQVNKQINELSDGMYKGLYKVYRVIYSPTSVMLGITQLEKETNIDVLEVKKHLNSNTTKAYLSKVDKNYEKYRNSLPALILDKDNSMFKRKRNYETNYPQVQRRIAEELLDLDKNNNVKFVDYDIENERVIAEILESYEEWYYYNEDDF